MTAAFKYILSSQASFFGLTALEIGLDPHGLVANHGLSYYGGHSDMAALYTASLLVTALLLQLSASSLPKSGRLQTLAFCLRAFCVLLVGLAATPIGHSVWMSRTHVGFGVSLFGVQFATAAWLAFGSGNRKVALTLIALLTVTVVVTFLSLVDVLRLELVGELIYQILFAALLDSVAFTELAIHPGHEHQ